MRSVTKQPGVQAKARRPAPAKAHVAVAVFVWRTFLKAIRLPEQVIDVMLIPLMFTLIFTYMFGGALVGSPSEYIQYLLPGTLVMTVLFVTVYTAVTLNTDVTTGLFDRLRALPIWRPAPLVGALVGDTMRYLPAALIVIALGLLIGFRPEGGFLGVALAIMLVQLFAFSVSWIWMTLALLLRTPGAVQISSMVVLFPAAFVSNIFVEPSTMPAWLHGFVDANPVSLLVTATRDFMHGNPISMELYWTLVTCGALTAVFAPLTMHLYHRKNTR